MQDRYSKKERSGREKNEKNHVQNCGSRLRRCIRKKLDLFHDSTYVWSSKHTEKLTEIMESFADSYRSATTSEERKAILSIVAQVNIFNFLQTKSHLSHFLLILLQIIPGLTRYRFTSAARRFAAIGCPKKTVQDNLRNRYNYNAVRYFDNGRNLSSFCFSF